MSKINYNLQQIRGIAFDVDGVLSPAVVPLDEQGIPSRMANLRDGYAMVQAVKQGYHLSIISGADTSAVRKRFELIGIDPADIYLGSLDKISALNEWMCRYGMRPENVAYVGDDIPDIQPMMYVGLPVCPADAAPDVIDVARYISPANGGYGVARDLIEEIMKAQNRWTLIHEATGI